MRNKYFIYSILLFLVLGLKVQSQEKHLNLEDAVLGYYKGLYPKTIRALQWVKETENYIYLEEDAYLIKDTKNNLVQKITLSDIQATYPSVKRMPRLQYIDKSTMVFGLENAMAVYSYNSKRMSNKIAYDEVAQNQDFCIKNRTLAYTIGNNLYIADQNKDKTAVTDIKDENIVSGQAIHRFEFGISKGTFWSPKGNYLAFYQKDESDVKDYPLVDITTYPASLKNIKYPMAGEGSEHARIGVYNMQTGKLHYLNIDTKDEHYLTNLGWSPDEKYITLAEVNRAQNHMDFNVYDVVSGNKVKTVFQEDNEKWVEPETPALFNPNSNTKFLWLSEKDGFMNVYQYDLFSRLYEQITDFNFVVTNILGFDKTGENIFLQATGKDPKGLQVFQVNLKTKKATQITKPGGTHRAYISDSGSYILDSYSALDTPRKIGIINTTDLKQDCNLLLEAENPLKDYKIADTEFVQLKAVDGTPLEARILKPKNFDKNKKYPVMVYVYGGPHAQLVKDTWLGGASLCMNYLVAEKDYIVFTLDGRGSAHRGFAFESSIHRHQGDVAMQDQMTGVEYLKSLPYVDADRMAVFGWSYGGFMTISMMLRHAGVFTTGIAGGPVTDWKYYEVMYGERYMDTPQENPDGYKIARVHNYITNLEGDLLIIHGSVDDTVVPQHSMTLLKEAVEKGVQLDFFTYPMHPHNVRGKDRVHLMTKVVNYILEHNK